MIAQSLLFSDGAFIEFRDVTKHDEMADDSESGEDDDNYVESRK